MRVEKRDAGADANPYLLMAADIAAGLDGIEQGATLPNQAAMPARNSRRANPNRLATAIEKARGSDWLKDVMGELQWELYLQQAGRGLSFLDSK